MIKVYDTPLAGLKVLESERLSDVRGSLRVLFTAGEMESAGIDIKIKTLFYSINKKDVIRGMHFQTPPAVQAKIVYVSAGRITDAAVDIRKHSATYGKYFAIELCGDDDKCLFIPPGFAHGFASRKDGTIVHYAQSCEYNKECGGGIRYDSFGYDWQVSSPILSDKDKKHPALIDFASPF